MKKITLLLFLAIFFVISCAKQEATEEMMDEGSDLTIEVPAEEMTEETVMTEEEVPAEEDMVSEGEVVEGEVSEQEEAVE